MDKKLLVFISFFLVLAAVAFYWYQRKPSEMVTEQSNQPSPTSTEATDTVLTDEEQIKAALVEKNGWDPKEIAVTVSENDGTYASGGAGSVTPGPGAGLWFAKKVDGEWRIVWDGNGIVTCEEMEDYPDYPVELIPRCYDTTSGEMVER